MCTPIAIFASKRKRSENRDLLPWPNEKGDLLESRDSSVMRRPTGSNNTDPTQVSEKCFRMTLMFSAIVSSWTSSLREMTKSSMSTIMRISNVSGMY